MTADLRPVHKAMIALRADQIPFATALALTRLAQGVAAAETQEVDQTFKSPTPFTEKAFRIQSATKAKPVAIVAVKDIQAQYLKPYIVGGDRFLGTKKGMLAPRDIGLNAYGNLTKGKLASLKGKPGVFIGPVHTKGGKVINGVWQRPTARKGKKNAQPAPLKLLIRFEDTTPAPKHLAFQERARAYVKANASREFDAALRKAMATRR